MAEGACTQRELGMALLAWHVAISRGVQTQDCTVTPFRLGFHWPPVLRDQHDSFFSSINFNCSCSVLSHSLFIAVPGSFFPSVAPVHGPVSPACWAWKSHLVLHSTHLSDVTHAQLYKAICFDTCAVFSHDFPSQMCTAPFSQSGCSFWDLKSYRVFLFCLICCSACLQVPTDSDIHF